VGESHTTVEGRAADAGHAVPFDPGTTADPGTSGTAAEPAPAFGSGAAPDDADPAAPEPEPGPGPEPEPEPVGDAPAWVDVLPEPEPLPEPDPEPEPGLDPGVVDGAFGELPATHDDDADEAFAVDG
jgi:hypothetical protein